MNYTRIYKSIIERGRNRTLGGFVEVHHIIPTSLGGWDVAENRVKLTPKEHFVCHHLLTKMHSGQAMHKMMKAWFMMANSRGLKHTARMYEMAKRNISKQMVENNPMFRPEVVAKRQAALTHDQSAVCTRRNNEYWADPDNKKALSDRNKERYKDPAVGELMSKKMKKVWADPEMKARHAESMRRAWAKRKGAEAP